MRTPPPDERAFHATSGDLALLVTYSGDLIPSLSVQLETLRSRRCRLAVVSSAARVAERFGGFDLPLVVPHRESKQGKVATFYSQTCMRYALDCVYPVAFSKNYAANLRDKDIIEMEGIVPGMSGR